MSPKAHILIIGGGAAGLAASIFAAEHYPNTRIVVLDGARSIGTKILVSGGGRCNVTNATVTHKDFHAPPRIVQRILKRFNEHDTVQWFESMGVPLKEESTGKIFPVTNKSRSVLSALLRRCEELGVEIKTRHRVSAMTKNNDGYCVEHEKGQIVAERVILATGGKSLPKSGSNGFGWNIAQQLGHTMTKCYPALVPLVLDDQFFHKELSGTSHDATITTTVHGKLVDRRTGSFLWTHFGVSGPVVMDASRYWVKAYEQGLKTTFSLSFFPDQTFDEIDRWLRPSEPNCRRKSLGAFLSQRLPQRVAKTLCTYVGKGLNWQPSHEAIAHDVYSLPIGQLSRQSRRLLTDALTSLSLPVVRIRGWNYAEVTAGGIPLGEINTNSMASRKTPGLFIIGEMLDCDGRIGGFNFQWAWSTGYIAGRSAGENLSFK